MSECTDYSKSLTADDFDPYLMPVNMRYFLLSLLRDEFITVFFLLVLINFHVAAFSLWLYNMFNILGAYAVTTFDVAVRLFWLI
jgi:hypothetical protein